MSDGWGGVAWHGVAWRGVAYGMAWRGLRTGVEWSEGEWSGLDARGGGLTSLSGSSAPQVPESVSEGFSFSRSSAGVVGHQCIGPED